MRQVRNQNGLAAAYSGQFMLLENTSLTLPMLLIAGHRPSEPEIWLSSHMTNPVQIQGVLAPGESGMVILDGTPVFASFRHVDQAEAEAVLAQRVFTVLKSEGDSVLGEVVEIAIPVETTAAA